MNPFKKNRLTLTQENKETSPLHSEEPDKKVRISSIEPDASESKNFLKAKSTFIISAVLVIIVLGGVFFITKLYQRPTGFLQPHAEKSLHDAEKRLLPDVISENIHLRRGKESYFKGYFNDAIAEFKEVIESSASDAEKAVALTYIGIISDEQGKTDEAIEYYRRALRFNGSDPLIYRNLAIAYRRKQDYAAAKDAIERAISLDPQNTGNRVLYGNILFEQRDYAGAKKMYQEALERDPENPSALYNLGIVLLKSGDKVSGMEYLKKAGEADKIGKVAHMSYSKLGVLYSSMMDYNSAEKYLKMAIAVNPTDPIDRYNMGLVYLKKNDKEKALAEFLKAQELTRNDARVLEGLGEAYFTLKEYDKSLEIYHKLSETLNRDARILSRIAEIYYEKGDLGNAYEYYKKITIMEPASENARIAYLNMGNIMDDAGRYEEAIESYKKALLISPKDDAALYNLGIAYRHAGKVELALEVWKKAADLNPENPRPLLAIADFYYEKKYFDLAMDEYQKILRRWPNIQEAHFNLGAVYYHTNQLDYAIGEYKKVLEINDRNDLARKALVNLAILTSKKSVDEKGMDEALQYAQKALLLKANDPEALFSLGVVYYRREMIDKAIDVMYQVVRASKDAKKIADAYNYIGMGYFKKGSYRKALQAFNRGVEEDPSNEELRVNRKTAADAYERSLGE
ncbi:MAG: tetratricopeptide repeat protein [Spirochaetes bacterium]|nr:tetratricopeptide repeat protein [Spirochaetota bacterium]